MACRREHSKYIHTESIALYNRDKKEAKSQKASIPFDDYKYVHKVGNGNYMITVEGTDYYFKSYIKMLVSPLTAAFL